VRFVFSDAARYRITAASEPASGRTSYRERVVSVVAVDPDPRAAMPAILFFTALVAAGLAAGRWTKIRAG
ncbi:MAG TPA: hypothetical protein VNO43_02270, partial [Candidatus Eisenbacteria bacterium]|nr:hypothetical protein [Candidatus Eisenbacteria bacterium]